MMLVGDSDFANLVQATTVPQGAQITVPQGAQTTVAHKTVPMFGHFG